MTKRPHGDKLTFNSDSDPQGSGRGGRVFLGGLCRKLGIMLIMTGVLALAGCGFPWIGNPFKAKEGTTSTTQHAPALPSYVNKTGADGKAMGVPQNIYAEPATLRMRIYQLTLPLGAFSLNEKIWRQLDEDTLDSATTVLLAQNGLRAAVGPQDRWSAIYKILEGPGTSFQEYLCQTDGRSAVQVITRQNLPEQTIFYVDRDFTALGRTFDRCDNAMRLSMSRLKESSDMLVQVEPFVILGTIGVNRDERDLGVVRTTHQQEQTFHNLRVETRLAGKNFLVLAPLNPKTNAFSVGTHFLSDSEKVPPTETVLIFVPIKK